MRQGRLPLLRIGAPPPWQWPAFHPTTGPKIVDARVKETMKEVLGAITDGSWAAAFIADQDAGAPDFKRRRAEAEAHPIEETGRQLRGLMSWVSASDDYTGTAARC